MDLWNALKVFLQYSLLSAVVIGALSSSPDSVAAVRGYAAATLFLSLFSLTAVRSFVVGDTCNRVCGALIVSSMPLYAALLTFGLIPEWRSELGVQAFFLWLVTIIACIVLIHSLPRSFVASCERWVQTRWANRAR